MQLLLLHGVNNTPNAWLSVRNLLEEHGHECITVFLPASNSVDDIATQILQGLPLGQYWVVGHSFGGMVALALAQLAPERTAGVALVNSSVTADTEMARSARAERVLKAEAGQYAELANAASDRAYHPANKGRPDLLEAREVDIAAYGAERYIAHQKAMACRPDRSQFLRDFSAPKLAVIAEGDVVIPAESQAIVALECGMSIVKIPLAGHMLPMEQPAALASALLTWVEN
jgi:pimeloyl-ACP methyl ester carboxylesterase